MKLKSIHFKIGYLLICILVSFFLFKEYTYVHPYNPGPGLFGASFGKWSYTSTRTFTWWVLLYASVGLMTPLLLRQKIGLLGCILFVVVFIRPIIQHKFPEESAIQFLNKNKKELTKIINQTQFKHQILIGPVIQKAGFEKLIIKDSIYYFFFYDENIPFGFCYNLKDNLNKAEFGLNIQYQKVSKNWYSKN